MTEPKGSIVSTTTTTTSASRLLLLSIHSSTLGVRFSVDYAFFNSCSFILNPPGFECGGKEDTHRGRSEHMCVCISCPLSTAEAVHSAGECESLYLSEMHTNAPAPHHADITPPTCYWPLVTHHTHSGSLRGSGMPVPCRMHCNRFWPAFLLACFWLLVLCIVLSREYPGGHPTSDVSRVGS